MEIYCFRYGRPFYGMVEIYRSRFIAFIAVAIFPAAILITVCILFMLSFAEKYKKPKQNEKYNDALLRLLGRHFFF